MYDINIKNVKKGRKTYILCLIIGIAFIFIAGGILLSNFTKLNTLDSKTISTSVSIEKDWDSEGKIMYSPIYFYVVDGVEYTCKSNLSSNINPGTENKTIYYDSKNPSKCMSEYTKSNNGVFLIFMLIPLLFIVVAIVNILKVNKRIKLINELNKKGKLVKNLPYYLEDTGIVVNRVKIKRPVVNYALPSGSVIALCGDPRYDRKFYDADGMVDLVIDESNPSNYFIDFEINRLTGNLPSDYYNNPIQNNQPPINNINNNQQINPINNQQPFIQPQNSQMVNQQNYFNQNNNNNNNI